jgi:hypothetical protein
MCQIALASAARAILAHFFQKSLVVLIIICTPSRVITYTNKKKECMFTSSRGRGFLKNLDLESKLKIV